MKLCALSFVLVFSTALAGLSSCRHHKMHDEDTPDKNINYPAAYVVNGESSTLSVIRLSDNTVTETIPLKGAGHAGHGLFPHHIYQHGAGPVHRLAVALPGMDLSGGHGSITHGMKGRIFILDGVTGKLVKDIELPAMNHNATFSPDGTEIWTSQMEASGKVLVIDASTYAVKNTIAVGKEPAEVTFSADGSRVYVANGGSDNVTVINPATKAVIATLPVGHNPVAAWVGFDGKMYVDNEEEETVSVIDVATNTIGQNLYLGFMPGSVAHNPFKKELWVTDPMGSKVHYWTLNAAGTSWVKAGSFPAGAGAHAVAFTNDGTIAYVTNQAAHTVSLINVGTHVKVKDITVGKKPNGLLIKY